MSTAFVLSGGGVRGSIQVGAMEALAKKGIVPDTIYGTSTGALNSAGYAWLGMDGLKGFWTNIKRNSDVIKFNWLSLALKSQGLYNMEPMRALLEKAKIGDASAKTTLIKSIVTKVSLIDGQLLYCEDSEKDFLESVLASASVPFTTDPINGFVDGGNREITPLKAAIKAGHTEIHAILCQPLLENLPEKALGHLLQNGMRAVDILVTEVFWNDIRACIKKNSEPSKYATINLKWYAPNEMLSDSHVFNQKIIQRGFEIGKHLVENS